MRRIATLLFLFFVQALFGQTSYYFPIAQPSIAESALSEHPFPTVNTPTSSLPFYRHAEVRMRDFAEKADGYWLFEPVSPVPDTADLVVFLHGYGGYNPVLYGAWIKHLVSQGYVVVYPRYQKNLVVPRPVQFSRNAAKAVKDAIARVHSEGRTCLRTDRMLYIGHSYGGVTAANMGVEWQALGIPQPRAMLLCQPGSGPIHNAVKKSYEGLPADLLLIAIVGNKDVVVGDTFSRLVLNTAVHTPMRSLVEHYSEPYRKRLLTSSHAEPYAIDPDLDTGLRNYTVNRGAINTRTNVVDLYCYWKHADALLKILKTGSGTDLVFSDTPERRYLGRWFDGKPVRPLRVEAPEVSKSMAQKQPEIRGASAGGLNKKP